MKRIISLLLTIPAVMTAFGLTGCGRPGAVFADTIVYGTIYTADESRNFAEAIAVKDGKYIYVGDRKGAEKYAGSNTEVIEGTFIMPSAVESHAHYILEEAFKQGLYIECDNEDGSYRSVEDMVSDIADYRTAHPDCEGIFGYGWNKFNIWFMDTEVTREQIDAVVADIPVYIAGRELHSGWCNTKCLELAGVLYEECPAQGVVRDENGLATGRLNDEACAYVRNQVFGEILGYDKAVARTQEILLSEGYTMLLDPWSNYDGTDAMSEAVNKADKDGSLHMVVFLSYCIDSYDDYNEEIQEAQKRMNQYDTSHAKMKYIKLFADGTEDSGTAYMLKPYSTGGYGTKNWDSDCMKAVTAAANKSGLLVHIHAYGDASARQAVDAFESSDEENGKQYRNSIAHAPYITEEDMIRIRDLGIGICAAGNWAVGYTEENNALMEAFLGKERFHAYYFVDQFVKYGIRAGMSTDRPCADGFAEDVFDYIGVLTTGVDYREGYVTNPRRDTWVSVEDAIRMMTINGAWSLDADTERGSIEVGKYADFLVADENPFETELKEIHRISVMNTFFEGKCVFKR